MHLELRNAHVKRGTSSNMLEVEMCAEYSWTLVVSTCFFHKHHSWHVVWKPQWFHCKSHRSPTRFTANSNRCETVNHSDRPNGCLKGLFHSYCHLQREQCAFVERETLRWPVEHASPISSLTTGSNGIENIHWRDCRASQWSIHESPGCCLFPLILPFFHSFLFYECKYEPDLSLARSLVTALWVRLRVWRGFALGAGTVHPGFAPEMLHSGFSRAIRSATVLWLQKTPGYLNNTQ